MCLYSQNQGLESLETVRRNAAGADAEDLRQVVVRWDGGLQSIKLNGGGEWRRVLQNPNRPSIIRNVECLIVATMFLKTQSRQLMHLKTIKNILTVSMFLSFFMYHSLS